jgi:hypothetical protein
MRIHMTGCAAESRNSDQSHSNSDLPAGHLGHRSAFNLEPESASKEPSITLYCMGRPDLGEIALHVDRMTTVDQLTRHLRQLGHLNGQRPLTAWRAMQLRTGRYLPGDVPLADSDVQNGDVLYWRTPIGLIGTRGGAGR